MANSNAIKAGRAYIEIFADDSKLQRGLKNISRRMRAWGASIQRIGLRFTALGAAIATPLLLATKHFAKLGDTMDKMSQRTGMSVEALSELGFAAEQSGQGLDLFERSIARMQKNLFDVSMGLKAPERALTAMGLTAKQLTGLAPEEQFYMIAEALSKVQDETTKTGIAMQLFGRAGKSLLPLMKSGEGGINALRKEFKDLGLTMSGADAAAAAKLTDQMNILRWALKMVMFHVGSALAPAFSEMYAWLKKMIKPVVEWTKNNKGLFQSIAKVAGIILAVGGGLLAFSLLVKTVAFALSGLSVVISILNGVLIITKAILLAVLSPIGLVVAAVAGLGIALLYFTGTLTRIFDWMGERFGGLKDTATSAFKGISDALASGNIALAGQIAMAGLKVVWETGTHAMLEVWLKMKYAMLDAMQDLVIGVKSMWVMMKSGIKQSSSDIANATKLAWIGTKHTVGAISDKERMHQRAKVLKSSADDTRGISAQEKSELAALAKEDKAYMDEIRKKHLNRLMKSTREINDAKDKLKKLVDQASDEKNKSDNQLNVSNKKFGIQNSAAAAEKKYSSQGTFSAHQAKYLGYTTTVQKQQLDVLMDIRDNTNNIDNGGVT